MKRLTLQLFVLVLTTFTATAAFADYIYDFTVDTSSVDLQSGYIDMQFNGSNSPGLAAASITDFTGATLGTAYPSGNNVTGTLPGTVTIDNSSGYNDYFQALIFGNSITFTLDLTSVPENSFALSFFASDQTQLLTTDPSGYATTIDVNQTGTVVTNSSSQVTAALATPSVPEPGTLLLLGSGFVALTGVRRRGRR
jgi:hypothetical protein